MADSKAASAGDAKSEIKADVEKRFLGLKDGPSLQISSVLAGLWQLSGAHGYRPDLAKCVEALFQYVDAGENFVLIGTQALLDRFDNT